MKVLYIDPTSPKGHKNYNYGLLRNISKFCDIDLYIRENYLNLNEINFRNVKYIPNKYIPEILHERNMNQNVFRILSRFYQFLLVVNLKRIFNLKHYDLIVFSSVEIISFSIATYFINNRIIFVDHGVSNISTSKLRLLSWQHIRKGIEVIALEDYIKEYLETKIGIMNVVNVVKHPIPNFENRLISSKNKKHNEVIIFAPGLSNDEKLLEQLINSQDFIPQGIRVIARSKKHNIFNNKLEIYSNRISEEDYYNLMEQSDFVLLPYGSDYNFKTSGVFFEAIHFKKPILIHAINTLKEYKEEYPDAIELFETMNELFEMLKNYQNCSPSRDYDFSKISDDYSDEFITAQLKNSFISN